jgi:hypothetical protein
MSWVDQMYPLKRASAAAGDLESRAWVADYEVAVAKELQAKRAKARAAAYTPPAQLGLLETPPDTAAVREERPRRNRRAADGTSRAFKAMVTLLWCDELPAGSQRAIADRAATLAMELGVLGAEEHPAMSTLQGFSKDLLDVIRVLEKKRTP